MNRYLYIDKLKTLGLLLIFLAHVSPPVFLFQLRNFDVILMIIVSCILFFLSRKKLSFGDYILKRFKRLVIPTWIFLTIFFILSFLTGAYFNLKVIISSFALHGGIGYVWVIKIYLLVAIILPLIKPLLLKKEKILYIISLLSLILNEFFAFTGYFDNFAYKYIIGYIIPCFFIIIYSYWLTVSSTKKILLASLSFFTIYTVAAIFLFQKNGSYIDTNSFKYPFRIYYLSFGLSISSIFFIYFKKIESSFNSSKFLTQIVNFTSRNSLWLYLIHIQVVIVLNSLFDFNWFLKYILLIIFTYLITLFKNSIINIIKEKFPNFRQIYFFEG